MEGTRRKIKVNTRFTTERSQRDTEEHQNIYRGVTINCFGERGALLSPLRGLPSFTPSIGKRAERLRRREKLLQSQRLFGRDLQDGQDESQNLNRDNFL